MSPGTKPRLPFWFSIWKSETPMSTSGIMSRSTAERKVLYEVCGPSIRARTGQKFSNWVCPGDALTVFSGTVQVLSATLFGVRVSCSKPLLLLLRSHSLQLLWGLLPLS